MRAVDIMTSSVVTVDPDMPIKAVAKLLAERRISAVPSSTPSCTSSA